MNDVGGKERRLLLKPEEAGERLGIGRTKVFALIKAGDLQSVTIGRSRRVPVSACEEFVRGQQGAVRPGPAAVAAAA